MSHLPGGGPKGGARRPLKDAESAVARVGHPESLAVKIEVTQVRYQGLVGRTPVSAGLAHEEPNRRFAFVAGRFDVPAERLEGARQSVGVA